MLDTYAQEKFDENINMMVPYYLMASYAYYVQDKPIFSDAFFDNMGKVMLERWNDIEHFHKDHITKDDLKAGSFSGNYPGRVEGGLQSLRDEVLEPKKTTKRKPKKTKTTKKKAKPTPPADMANTMGAFGNPQDLFDFG